MGMFDYIQIDNIWLPEDARRPYEEQGFQTKDFDNAIETYSITEKGTIFKSNPDESFMPIVDFSGELNFYDFFKEGEGERFREFIAYVKNGTVYFVNEINI